ncbi:hypothetical protein NON00_15765 [Roseomonas sp. GC11]|uniref:YciI family protein n=1 Tax=Roseomonas sp. GC11 TaxID=2950546 RepID=UPI00210BDC88|nr:hypothetical protein [Roseomonas sp. GC11]MCQ4161377.1 hypothetical protein [Roseomonas sp. GC11]
MLFSITLSYLRPPADIQAHLDAHKAWLVRHIQAGSILCAGPLQNGQGGFILAHGEGLSDIEGMIAEDPFDRHGLASFAIQACDPAIRAGDFPARWAAGAKSA